jgi:nitrate/TMAO reductase-like tetraheme cytochrome c subunit
VGASVFAACSLVRPRPCIFRFPDAMIDDPERARTLAPHIRTDMHFPTILLLSLLTVSAVMIGVLVTRPAATASQGGKILAFLVLFLLPSVCMTMGVTSELERSTSTQFCLSCHTMETHGQSLYVDDPTYLAAAHFQNHRVPADQACYTCHTNYAMFGGARAKFNGLHHVYVQYFGKPHDPIHLYEPYNNRECLHCHLGARSFEEGAVHNADPDLLPAVKANKISCVSSGCHDVVHNADKLSNVKFWKGTR